MAVGIEPISASIQALTGIATAIASINDADKRRKFEQQIALMNFDQREKLDKALRESKSADGRQLIVGQLLSGTSVARIDALSKVQVEKEKTKKVLLITGIAGGIILLGGFLFLIAKRKN